MRHWIALEGVFSESRSAELARVKIARGTVDKVGVVVEAWCWRFVICVPLPAGRRTISNGTPGFGVPQRASRCFTYPPACTLLGYLRASIFHIFHILPYLGGDEGSTRLVSGVCGGCVVHVYVWWLLLEVHEVAKVISHLLLQYQGERDHHVRPRSIPISQSNTMGMQMRAHR